MNPTDSFRLMIAQIVPVKTRESKNKTKWHDCEKGTCRDEWNDSAGGEIERARVKANTMNCTHKILKEQIRLIKQKLRKEKKHTYLFCFGFFIILAFLCYFHFVLKEKEYEAGWVGKGGRSGRRWRGRENIVKIYYMKNRIKKERKEETLLLF